MACQVMTLPNPYFWQIHFLAGFAGQGVFNENPSDWLGRAKPPILSPIKNLAKL
jgi:hypothetical protein